METIKHELFRVTDDNRWECWTCHDEYHPMSSQTLTLAVGMLAEIACCREMQSRAYYLLNALAPDPAA